tara:strand:+ start:99 stop:242 length:144 start_codon:yes stop_codon:yes gene_type:complete
MKNKKKEYTKPDGTVYVLCRKCGNHRIKTSPCWACFYNKLNKGNETK